MKSLVINSQYENKRMPPVDKNAVLPNVSANTDMPSISSHILTHAFDNLKEGIAICDNSNRFIFRNDYLFELLEIDSEENCSSIETIFSYLISNKIDGRSDISNLKQHLQLPNKRKYSGNLYFNSTRIVEYACVPNESYGSVWRFRDITSEHKEFTMMHYQAHHDNLTGLPNRLTLHENLMKAINYSQKYRSLVAVIYFDLIKFKSVNDTFGHAVGDELLQAVCDRMQASIRPADTLARIGGDEFVLLVESANNMDDVNNICKRVINGFNQPFDIEGHSIRIGTSIGVSIYPFDANSEDELIQHADEAMYTAKKKLKSAISFFKNDKTT